MVLRKGVEAVYGCGYRNVESSLAAPVTLAGVQYPGCSPGAAHATARELVGVR